MTPGVCRLCGQMGPLVDSHVVPRFLCKKLKAGSGSYYVMSSNPDEPDERSQRDVVGPLFCRQCDTVTLQRYEDHLARFAMRPRPAMRRLLYVVLALFAVVMAWSLIDGVSARRSDRGVWIFPCMAAYLCAGFFLWMPYSIRRVYKQQKTLHVPIEVELTDIHFLTTSAHGTFQMPWKDFHKWKKNERMILVYQSEVLMHAIPLRALSDAADRKKLVEILSQNLGPEKP